jgi:hypothetical protein
LPIDLSFFPDGRGVHLECTGDLVARDFIGITVRLRASKQPLEKLCYALVDETRADSVTLSETDMRSLVDSELLLAPSLPTGLVLAVVAAEAEIYRTARLWRVYALKVGWETMAFQSLEQATTWLHTQVKKKFDLEISEWPDQGAEAP